MGGNLILLYRFVGLHLLLQEFLPYVNNWNVKSYLHDKGVAHHLFMTSGGRWNSVLLSTGKLSKNVLPWVGGYRLAPNCAAQTWPTATAGRPRGNGQVGRQ